MKTFLAGITLLLLTVSAGFGATLTVTNHDDSGPGSLRDAIATAALGDTIVFDLPDPATITLTSGELLINKGLTITGPGTDSLTIARSSSSGTPAFVIFNVLDGGVTISGLTITNGLNNGSTSVGGGGLHTQSALQLLLTRVNFINNHAIFGGALYSEGQGGARLRFCTLTGNSAVMGAGGAVYSLGDGGVFLIRCTVSSNSATYAGGAIASSGFVQVFLSTISDNVLLADLVPGPADGAGIYNGGGTLSVNQSTIANNDNARGNGGGVTNQGMMVVSDSTFFGNTAEGDGGAIENDGGATITDCTITNNTASQNSDNDHGLGGGGVAFFADAGGSGSLKNTIIAGNHSPSHPDLATPTDLPVVNSEGYNLIGDATDAEITPATGDQFGTAADPIDPMLGPLATNGGPTQTCALLPGSPAVDVGDPNAPVTDQRNFYRANAPDIGAFELGATIPTTLGNISTRLLVGTGDDVLIGGFIITGTHGKAVMLRAIGPSLPLDDTLADPFVKLHDITGATIASNDNWEMNDNSQDIIDSGLAPADSLESALLVTLDPGAYTAIVHGADAGSGIALVEAYDLDQTTDSKLANISTRGLVQKGDNVMIGGIIVSGNLDDTLLLRAIGPSLPLENDLADPFLELHDADGNTLISNDNWREIQETEIEATGLAPGNDAESAILTTLSPGAYTAIVRGVGDTTGIALVEAYGLN